MLEYGTPKEVLGLNNQMTLILQQLLQTHPAPAYHRKREIDVSFFDTNLNSSVRVVRDNLGKVTSKKSLLEEEIVKVMKESNTISVKRLHKIWFEKCTILSYTLRINYRKHLRTIANYHTLCKRLKTWRC